MPKKRDLFLWCLILSLSAITDGRADSRYALTPANGPAISKPGSIENPAIVYVESSPVFISVVEPAVSVAETSQYKPVNRWQAQARVDVPSPGLVESTLIPELHQVRAVKGGREGNQLDLCLLGPDGKPRGFELFWREKGRQETVALKQAKVELLDGRRLLWEGVVPDQYMVNKIIIDIADSNYVGKVDVEALNDSGWIFLVKNAALYKNNRLNQAEISILDGPYQRFRLYFSGYDEKFRDRPLFVSRVQAVGTRSGRDYENTSFQSEFEEITEDRATVVRVRLPGSGIWINDIKIATDALFQGEWQLGRETNVLGKREFSVISSGRVSHVGENQQTLMLDVNQRWPDQILTIRMAARDYFGRIRSVDIRARIPRMTFFADSAGRYTVRSGCGNAKPVLDMAGDRGRRIDHQLVLTGITRNLKRIHDNLAEKYRITGGPFHQDGYAWKADVRVDEPGFYQVVLNKRVCLEEKLSALRLVRDNNQVPYFLGFEEERYVRLEASEEYDANQNRTVYTVRLPFASSHWAAIKLSAEGLFERTLVFQKHVPGMIGWQPWKTRRWVGRQGRKTDFILGLNDFPRDQDEVRLIVDHGDDQPLDIQSVSAGYSARDLFFLASTPGTYTLFGGNPDASAVSYKDFEMIKDELLAAVPRQVKMGDVESVQTAGEENPSGKDMGGPFDDSGYTWASSLGEITKSGFYQLRLNQQASLENNRHGLRLVRDNQQVPYFLGGLQQRGVALSVEKEYERDRNETTWTVKLPRASAHWHKLRMTAEGVFSRDLVLEVRKPGNTGWQVWKRVEWTNRHAGETVLETPLAAFPKGQTEIRLVMRHGDNKPIDVKKVEAVYTTRDMFFIAGQGDGYRLVGGNPAASAPSYDLALIRDHVLKKEPIKISMDEMETLKPAAWKTKISHTFSEQGWGLYAVLGLVTLILLIVIVRLFPKED